MKKMILSGILLLTLFSTVEAFDQTGKTAIGVTGGRVFPFGSNKFNDEADGSWAYGGYIRHGINPNWGIDVAATRQNYDKICTCTRSNIVDVLGFYRFKGTEDFTPIAGLGLGVVDNGKHQNLHLGTRARVGMEKAINENVAVGMNFDYQGVRKMPGAKKGPQPSDINTITPKLELTWYFGK